MAYYSRRQSRTRYSNDFSQGERAIFGRLINQLAYRVSVGQIVGGTTVGSEEYEPVKLTPLEVAGNMMRFILAGGDSRRYTEMITEAEREIVAKRSLQDCK